MLLGAGELQDRTFLHAAASGALLPQQPCLSLSIMHQSAMRMLK